MNLAAVQALTARADALQAQDAELRTRIQRLVALLAGQQTAPARQP